MIRVIADQRDRDRGKRDCLCVSMINVTTAGWEFFPGDQQLINQTQEFNSPPSSDSAEETSLLLLFSFCFSFSHFLLSSTLSNETVTDWEGKRLQIRVVLTSQPDRWTPLRISWRTRPLSPETRRQSRPSTPRPLSPVGSSPPRCSSPPSGSGTGSVSGTRDKRERGVTVMENSVTTRNKRDVTLRDVLYLASEDPYHSQSHCHLYLLHCNC